MISDKQTISLIFWQQAKPSICWAFVLMALNVFSIYYLMPVFHIENHL